jgi:hypothetical protein
MKTIKILTVHIPDNLENTEVSEVVLASEHEQTLLGFIETMKEKFPEHQSKNKVYYTIEEVDFC